MIEILRKSYVALLVLLLALVAQIPHAAYVFDAAPRLGLPVQTETEIKGWLLAYAYAIALESATLMFVVHGHKGASYGFAVASFLVNMCYYSMHGVDLWGASAIPAWLLSALLPVAIASYSHILAGAQDEPLHWPQWLQHLRNRATPIVQPEIETVQVEAHAIVHKEIGSVQPEGATVHDGAPDPTDRPAYARWLHMEKGVAQSELATQFGVHRNTIGKWLKEKVQ